LLKKAGVPEAEAKSRAYVFYAYLMAEAIIVADKSVSEAARPFVVGAE
jgi:hypothetical protein